ncbi:MAG TPA: SapC family protein [Telluria sp.]|nr:SapC family protein [Telluria sp.]
MTRHALLNNVDHKDLRIVTRPGARYGDDQMSALTFPAEFRAVQAHYPIVFSKAQDGTGFYPLALFGVQEGENLFLDGDTWDGYIPLAVRRQPFLIGRNGDELMLHVDLDSPRVGTTEGEAVFLPHGGSTEYLEGVNEVLSALHRGLEATPAFVEALLRHELLESFVLDIELDDGSQNRLAGLYTIHEERLNALDGAALEQLHRAGHLEAIYMVLASMTRFRALIDRKNRRHVHAG